MEVLAGDDGRVFKLLDRGDGVMGGGCAGGRVMVVFEDAGDGRRSAGSGGLEGGADAPTRGHGHAGLDGDLLDRDVGGIHHEALPLEAGHLTGDAVGDDGVEVDVDG